MFDMRLLLETAAARWAAERASDELRAEISAEAATTVGTDGRRPGRLALARRVHHARRPVPRADRRPPPATRCSRDGIARLHAHLHLHRRYFPYAETGTTSDEHQRIAVAIQAGAPDAAEAAMREHLSRARERHLPAFD